MAANGLIGHYHFFSWAGAGLRLALRNADNPAVPAPVRPQLKAELTVQAEKAGSGLRYRDRRHARQHLRAR